MSNEFEISSAFTGGFPQETLEDVQKLQERGHRIRSKGGLFLGAAVVATAISVFALVLYHQAEPATAFTSIDVPLLNEVLSKTAPTGVASTLNDPFPSAANQLIGMMEGTVGKIIALFGLASGLAIAIIRQNIAAAASGVMMAMGMFYMPAILSSMLQIPPQENSEQADAGAGKKFVKQLVDEKRYAELSSTVDTLMPPAQSAYVKAQVAYLSKQSAGAKAELDKLITLGGKWEPSWERMSVMEHYAYGSARSSWAMKYETSARESMSTRNTAHLSAGAMAIILGVAGVGVFGFGTVLSRRADRLMKMLAINSSSNSKKTAAAEMEKPMEMDYTGQVGSPLMSPAYAYAASPARESMSSSSSGTDNMLMGMMVGAAAATILEDTTPSRSSGTTSFGGDYGSGCSSSDSGDSGDCGGGD